MAVHESFDLRDFPFDVQDLNLRVCIDNAQIELACVGHHGAHRPHITQADAVAFESDRAVRVEAQGLLLADLTPISSKILQSPAVYRLVYRRRR